MKPHPSKSGMPKKVKPKDQQASPGPAAAREPIAARKSRAGSILILMALTVVVIIAWGLARDRLSIQHWKTPTDYKQDSLEWLAWIKSASEGDFVPFWTEGSHRLDAPYEAVWYDYPTSEKFLIYFLGLVARNWGLMEASNLGLILVHILSALSFYLCCRVLKHSKTWSFIGAVLYSLTYYNIIRNLGHLHLACTYTLPFAMLSCWLVLASRRMRPWDRFSWICLATALVMGLSGPYFLNIYLQFLCFCMLVQYLTTRRRENLKIGAGSLALAAFGFVAINARSLAYQWVHGKNPLALARHYFETELYALKPIELLVPPVTHHIEKLAELGDYYNRQAYVRGETGSPYLGIIVCAGLMWLFTELFLRIVRNGTRPARLPPYGPQIGWIFAYSVIGGVNCVIALCGFQLFRGTNRYSIFISLLVLMFLVARTSVLTRRWPAGLKLALATVLLAAGLYDQLPRRPTPDEAAAIETKMTSDRDFSQRLEALLPPGGMVFELPVMVFPEAPPINDVGGYEMLRPFLFTKTLRFSYGAIRGRTREDWQGEAEKLPAGQMIDELERFGFSAIYLNRACYTDRGEDLLKTFAAQGRNVILEDDRHEQVCVGLQPSSHPELPHTEDRAQITFHSGWTANKPTASEQWSSGNATLSFFNEQRQPASYSVRCLVASYSPRSVTMLMNGKVIWSAQIGANQAVALVTVVEAGHGNNVIEFTTDAGAVQTKDAPNPVAFVLMNLEITKLPP
jgi:phosphoglycerol transferase